jgi:hypothetical protein
MRDCESRMTRLIAVPTRHHPTLADRRVGSYTPGSFPGTVRDPS